MGAGSSIILSEDPLSGDFDNLRNQVWGDVAKKETVNTRVRRGSRSTIQQLASQQLSTKIQTHRVAARSQRSLGVPPAIDKKDIMYSKSIQNISVSHDMRKRFQSPLKSNVTEPATGLSPRSSRRVVSFDESGARRSIELDSDANGRFEETKTSPRLKQEHTEVSPQKDKVVRKKPNLVIQALESSCSDGIPTPHLNRIHPSVRQMDIQLVESESTDDSGKEDYQADSLMFRRKAQFLKIQSNNSSPSNDESRSNNNSNHNISNNNNSHNSSNILKLGSEDYSNIRLSPGGSTAIVGHWKIKETGLQVSPRPGENSERIRDKGSDSYVEIQALGSGASGTVVEALHVPTLTIVALKVLPVHNPKKNHFLSQELAVLYKNLTDLRLVDKEGLSLEIARTQSTPRCRYVLSMYDAFIDTRACKINLVMEIMDGGSLQDLVENGGCRDEKVLADIAYQVIRGLQYLHSQKQMHRDIKPGNILLNCQGWVKVADFGISKAMDNTFGCAKSFVGTMCYMAPERIAAKSYGFPADIWSMGLTLLAVAKGQFPLPDQSEGFWGLLHSICDSEPPSPGPDFSADFNDFILRCLKKDPDERWTPSQLLEHPFLGEFKQGHPRRSIFSEAESEPNSTTSSMVSNDGETQQALTLARLAATKDLNDDDELYDIRLDHLVNIAEILQTRCVQRESGLMGSLEGTPTIDEFNEDGNGLDEFSEPSMVPIAPPQPIKLPCLTGAPRAKWRHLAEQLYLPVETVISTIRKTVDERFFNGPDVDEY